jgi:hypothetical protein
MVYNALLALLSALIGNRSCVAWLKRISDVAALAGGTGTNWITLSTPAAATAGQYLDRRILPPGRV